MSSAAALIWPYTLPGQGIKAEYAAAEKKQQKSSKPPLQAEEGKQGKTPLLEMALYCVLTAVIEKSINILPNQKTQAEKQRSGIFSSFVSSFCLLSVLQKGKTGKRISGWGRNQIIRK